MNDSEGKGITSQYIADWLTHWSVCGLAIEELMAATAGPRLPRPIVKQLVDVDDDDRLRLVAVLSSLMAPFGRHLAYVQRGPGIWRFFADLFAPLDGADHRPAEEFTPQYIADTLNRWVTFLPLAELIEMRVDVPAEVEARETPEYPLVLVAGPDPDGPGRLGILGVLSSLTCAAGYRVRATYDDAGKLTGFDLAPNDAFGPKPPVEIATAKVDRFLDAAYQAGMTSSTARFPGPDPAGAWSASGYNGRKAATAFAESAGQDLGGDWSMAAGQPLSDDAIKDMLGPAASRLSLPLSDVIRPLKDIPLSELRARLAEEPGIYGAAQSPVQGRLVSLAGGVMAKAFASREEALLAGLFFPLKGVVKRELAKVEAEVPVFAEEFVAGMILELGKMTLAELIAMLDRPGAVPG